MLADGDKGVVLLRNSQRYFVAPRLPGGVISTETLEHIAQVAKEFDIKEIKIRNNGTLALLGLDEERVDDFWAELAIDKDIQVGENVRSVRSCLNACRCKEGMRDSTELRERIEGDFSGIETPARFEIGISDCINDCAQVCLCEVGVIGTIRGWRLLVGGCSGPSPALGFEAAEDLNDEQVLEMIEKTLKLYTENAKKRQRLRGWIDSMDFEDFCKMLKSE